jgi:Short C-terminal domain
MSEGDVAAKQGRRALPLALVVVASVVLLISAFAIWAKRQALETETWTETSAELLEDEAIRDALADFLVVELYDNVDVEAEIAAPLPERAKPLAGPVAGALRQLAGEVARRVLAEERVQGLWEDANRIAHEQLLAILEDETEVVSITGGSVVLDLTAVLGAVTESLGIGADIASRLPADAAQLEVIPSDDLDTVQTGLDVFRAMAWFLAGLTLVLYALAIYLAADRRREVLRAAGLSFIVVGAAVMVGQRIGGNVVVDALSEAASADDAVAATWRIGTTQLTEIAHALILYGILIVIAAWLAGPSPIATSIRAATAPWFRRPAYAYGAIVALLILLFWWNPTPATHRLAPSLLLIGLALLGTEMLRRRVIGEFPDRVAPGSSAGIAQALAARMREARERRIAGTAGAPAAHAAGEARIAALERLAELRDSEVLTPEEFAAEKQRILGR